MIYKNIMMWSNNIRYFDFIFVSYFRKGFLLYIFVDLNKILVLSFYFYMETLFIKCVSFSGFYYIGESRVYCIAYPFLMRWVSILWKGLLLLSLHNRYLFLWYSVAWTTISIYQSIVNCLIKIFVIKWTYS